MAYCDDTDLWTPREHLVATQYRESTNLKAMMEIAVDEVSAVAAAICGIEFDLDTATGDQLDIIGKVMGVPRTHCDGPTVPVMGFTCGCPTGKGFTIGGMCEGAIFYCKKNPPRRGPYTHPDDDEYRRFLKAAVYRNARVYSKEGLIAAAQELFGEDAGILYPHRKAAPSVYTGRALTDVERTIGHLFASVLPVPPGLKLRIYETTGAPSGFGTGWGEMCTSSFPARIAA